MHMVSRASARVMAGRMAARWEPPQGVGITISHKAYHLEEVVFLDAAGPQ